MQIWNFEQHIYGGKLGETDEYVYASLPNGFFLNKSIIRIYFSNRNFNNVSLHYFLYYDLEKKEIVFYDAHPLLNLGRIGTFDDSGIMPTCVLKYNTEILMYYIGWNLSVTVPFRNSIGIAKSKDNGFTFEKLFDGPILDRTKLEPYFVASSCVLFDEGKWKLWYLSCVRWEVINEKTCHFYHIKYAESSNGIDWKREGIVAIDFKNEIEYAISVPRVIKEDEIYKMWYSYRGSLHSENYRIGYAESFNGIEWTRMDENVIINLSENNWDSEMQCYPFVFDHNNERYMLYNGNGYGKTGFGLAKLQKEK